MEKKPSKAGDHYGELSPGGQWWWRGTGSKEDQWVQKEWAGQPEVRAVSKESRDPGVAPLAASPSFYITVTMTYPGGATQIGQATTYQVITPWGQSTACISLLDAFNQMVAAGSSYSGQMWNYLSNGVTRGLVTTGGATVPSSASYFQAAP